MSEAFVVFREALEGVLVVGILARFSPRSHWPYIGVGVFLAVVVSILGAFLLHRIASAHMLWEIGISLMAAVLLLSMVVWMRRRSIGLAKDLREIAQTQGRWIVLATSFSAVAREGLETVVFLRALWGMQERFSWLGGVLGLALALGIGVLLFVFTRRVPLQSFFNVTSILLLLIAAGMASYGVHELIELGEAQYGWAATLAEHKAWDLFSPLSTPPERLSWAHLFIEGKYYPPLHHKGWVGAILNALTGWRASMTWAEVVIWLAVFIGGVFLWRKQGPSS
ncbi:MAG: FTR1 family protein [Bacteroidia bacterium]|nr:FTR1 family protein [Bacteroidia bacterium]